MNRKTQLRCGVEVWVWIRRIFFPHFMMDVMLTLKLNHASINDRGCWTHRKTQCVSRSWASLVVSSWIFWRNWPCCNRRIMSRTPHELIWNLTMNQAAKLYFDNNIHCNTLYHTFCVLKLVFRHWAVYNTRACCIAACLLQTNNVSVITCLSIYS